MPETHRSVASRLPWRFLRGEAYGSPPEVVYLVAVTVCVAGRSACFQHGRAQQRSAAEYTPAAPPRYDGSGPICWIPQRTV